MSFYVTCVGPKTFVDMRLRCKYEVALAEVSFRINKHFRQGKVTYYKKRNTNSEPLMLGEVDFDSFESLNDIEEAMKNQVETFNKSKKTNHPIPTISVNELRLFTLTCAEGYTFKLSEEAKRFLGTPSIYIDHYQIPFNTLFMTNNEIYSFECDIISDQIYGNKKLKLLRNVQRTNTIQNHHVFSTLHYLPLDKTDFDYINITAFDYNRKPIVLDENAIFKLHFRPKLI